MVDVGRERIRVLHVDDDVDIGDPTAPHLEHEGDRFDVETVPDAGTALGRLDAGGVDCVVSGHDLPDRTGLEFLRAVRDRRPDLPFILYTAAGSEAVASEAISAGVTDYLRRGVQGDDALLAKRIHDAVEGYRAERTLRRSERRLDAVFEDPKMLVGVLSPDGRLHDANHTAMELVDADHEDLVGEPFWETPWWSDENRADVREWVERAAGGEYVEYEADHVGVDGDRRSVSGTIRPVTDESGTVVSLIASARDITERREHARELRRRNERLDQFTSVVSHDLRNPLNVATGNLSVARRDAECDHLDEAAHALERMGNLIDDLLTLARAGDRVSDVETVDLAATVRECWRNVSTSGASLDVETTRSIRADRSQLQHLLENLLRNAITHGGEDVTITVGDRADGFYVADDGPGIPEGQRETVFESGYSTSSDGTGFGLSIVAEIADAHDWDVAVAESAAGGTRFGITGVACVTDPCTAD
ncbi:ATP-binding protein [Haloplanus halophilus]|uniref:ATP-binding protein n=1 Tax=Haloplanus halophilus TaxID=2949993 RepID=UPI0020408145|nr:ATP-binding protein [Haloplanus sp. GDY1]